MDLYKTDVYSLALTFLKALTKKKINKINESQKKEIYMQKILEEIDLPLQMK